ncbi:MAG TPA: ABC transporter ATP-binding protein [Phycisphaerales bacterium]|nr:ABC transporter ATP-binding protein [Phycisphaerales bacterium]
MSTTIVIKDLVKSYPAIAPGPGSPPTTTAVDRVSLTINAGELFFLLGPSGCGKTTLLRMIAGFIEPTSGNIVFQTADGSSTDVTFMPAEKRDTGMVFQSYALWPHMTVAQNVAFGLEVRKVPAQEREQRVREALAAVRMDQYAARKPNQLSGGQQQRIALARAIVVKPRVLLLDEPLSNLDAKLRIELRSEIRRVCKTSGITTVYVTHDQKEALSMADRIAIMRSGNLVQLGSPSDLYRKPADRFVAEFLGETNIFEGKVCSTGNGVEVETPLGRLQSANPSNCPVTVNDTVLVSLRHECIRLGTGSNTISGTVKDTMYLGEIAQLELASNSQLLALSVLNPRDTLPVAGASAQCTVDPHDVVLLPYK